MITYLIILVISIISVAQHNVYLAGGLLGLALINLLHIQKMEEIAREEREASAMLSDILAGDFNIDVAEIKPIKSDRGLQ